MSSTAEHASDTTTDELPHGVCGCGFAVVYTPEGWQHDVAPWFWGADHDPDPDADALAAADAYDTAHPDQDKPEAGVRVWTFFGHWENDRIVVEYHQPGQVCDQREDTGHWAQGLWAASAEGATREAAQAAALAEYQEA